MSKRYFSYKNFSLELDTATAGIRCFYHSFGDKHEKVLIDRGRIVFKDGSPLPELPEPEITNLAHGRRNIVDFRTWKFSFRSKDDPRCCFDIFFNMNHEEAAVELDLAAHIKFVGLLRWGDNPEKDTFAGEYDSRSTVLHCSSGPAVHAGDDALFDRKQDRLLHLIPRGDLKLSFDWKENAYAFEFGMHPEVPVTILRLHVEENYCERKFHIPYSPIDKRNWFTTPPVGWMTWYSVKFEASEKEVLENTAAMKKLLGDYCENLVSWVDWEWYHASHSGRGEDNSDIFFPRQSVYPNGMKYVAQKIRENGCIPALWVAPTNDGRMNKWFEAHPDCVLPQKRSWSGQWWCDPTREEVINDYIPAVFEQVKEWEYAAVKWDCLTSTLRIWEDLREHFSDPAVPLDEALHKLEQRAREVLGDDIFMLFCNAANEDAIAVGTDVFNAARVGGDVFGWFEFIDFAVDRLFYFYWMHNTMFYCDCDNIVLRSEYCTLPQVRSRVSFYGLSGVMLTVGDRFREYDASRLDMLRRIVPVVDSHAVDLTAKHPGGKARILLNTFARPWGDWQVAAVMNTDAEQLNITLDLAADCRLDMDKSYAVYDYWNKRFLGIYTRKLDLEIAAFDTVVLRITPVEKANEPLLISSSRHLTQGGYELETLEIDRDNCRLSGRTKCIGKEPCVLTFYIPSGVEVTGCTGGNWQCQDKIGTLTILTESNSSVNWSINYRIQ